MKAGWEREILGNIIQLEYGKPLPDEKRSESGKYPVYGANGEKSRTDSYYHDKKSIIVGRKGSAGEVNLTENLFWPLDVTYFVTFDEFKYDLMYLYHTLISLELPKLAKGVKPGINRNEVYSITVNIPPLTEQKRIVAILDEVFAAIAKAKENAQKNLANARELFESYLQGVFEMKGEGWEEKKLGDVCDRVSVGHVGETSKFYCNSSVGVPFLRSQNVRSGYMDLLGLQFITNEFHESLKKSQLKKGDLLFVRVGANRGDCCVIKDDFKKLNCANIVFARVKTGNVDFIDKYCRSVLGRKQLLGMTVGSAQGVINTKAVADLSIPFPSQSEQQKIIKKIDALSIKTNRLEKIYHQKITELDELKKSILDKAFRGEL